MLRIWKEYARFFREFRRDFHHTGAILPSGAFLARALTQPLLGPRPPARVLEVGPGTGAVTRVLAGRLQPGDRLDAVEINPHFAQALGERLTNDPAFAPHRQVIEIINAPIQEVPGEAVYDFIVSGLPLNNFTPDEIRSIFQSLTRLIRPGGVLTYFEYTLVRSMKMPFVRRAERQRLAEIGAILDQILRAHQVRRKHVLLNVPPAVVRHLKLKEAEPGTK